MGTPDGTYGLWIEQVCGSPPRVVTCKKYTNEHDVWWENDVWSARKKLKIGFTIVASSIERARHAVVPLRKCSNFEPK